ncbi:MAG: Fe-S cluster assembly protein SufD [Muribaculaceae bacterium]|nr:Fe-S cluster assembly protein SufD [Muribaculaceae bacterium]
MDTALKQYLDLYDSNREVVNAGAGTPLTALRDAARAALDGAALPTRRTEGYEKTSLEDMFAPDYGVNITRVGIPVDVAATFRCDVPNLSTLLATVVNDMFIPASTMESRLPDGVTFMSLARAAREMPELVGRHLGSLAPVDDPVVALDSLLMQDGVFIHVARGCRPDKALQLVNIFSSPVPMAAFRRLLVVLEEDAELRLLVCDHTQDKVNSYLGCQIGEVIVADGARFEMCAIEESSPATSRCTRLYISQGTRSEVSVNTTTLTCGNTRNDFIVTLDGEHAACSLNGMAIAGGEMHIDNNTSVTHVAPRCHSDQLFKYALDGNSSGAFEGSINVKPSAPFTEAYQSNRNILASEKARMHCKPQLIINNDEVKCSHGATTGQLDDDALFYMRSRGIPEAEARTMLMQAFMVDVIDTVRIPGLQEKLRHLVDRRFAGTLGDCATCHK